MSLRHPKLHRRKVSPTKRSQSPTKKSQSDAILPGVSALSMSSSAMALVPADQVERRRPYGTSHLSIPQEEVLVLPGRNVIYAQPLDVTFRGVPMPPAKGHEDLVPGMALENLDRVSHDCLMDNLLIAMEAEPVEVRRTN